MRSRLATVVLAALIAAPVPSVAQSFQKKDTVVVAVPKALYGSRKGMTSSYVIPVEVRNGIVSVRGSEMWAYAGFPSLEKRWIEKMAVLPENKKKNIYSVQLKAKGQPNLWLDISGESAGAALASLIVRPAQAPALLDSAYARFTRVTFTGPLADIPIPIQRTLLDFVHTSANGSGISSERFRDRIYMVVDLGFDNVIYNDNRLSQMQRLATLVNERVLNLAKSFAVAVKTVPAIDGLAIKIRSPHKALGTDDSMDYDRVEIYMLVQEIERFSRADITSQVLIDGSFVLINSNRVSLPLAQ